MPRKRQQPQQQPVREIPNQPYGMGQDLTEMQQKVPLPTAGVNNVNIPPAAPDTPGRVLSGPTSAEDTLLQAEQFEGPIAEPLGSHSARPGEPVTTGLTSGPGKGTEALYGNTRRSNPRADMLDMLAAASNDPKLKNMAQRARLTG